ncbi:YeeE/YedE thiosulfate transporter family protein [Devosia sp. YIM 151766]|uniref:YeeE/YedE family protein n=1 Tax=Devosia sp. YIM 151766 TaxID=3017325 RepID=UPI00255C5541|nr:YeeE/YedE thiosulfate transporter family protein [Devosia sp. YIM 151766]WIY53704.1 YeeE/YedE thiosulfate transporter family protein [Devosia sp. YIM 151766]
MTEFTPLLSLAGGSLIGFAAVLLMAFHGRIAGMTGILSGLVPPFSHDWGWRAAFLLGAVAAPALIVAATGFAIPFDSATPAPWLVVGGLIVGIGVYFGSGCTSGHGVCGMARLSPRSIIATLTFMASTVATVFVIRHLLGGLS